MIDPAGLWRRLYMKLIGPHFDEVQEEVMKFSGNVMELGYTSQERRPIRMPPTQMQLG